MRDKDGIRRQWKRNERNDIYEKYKKLRNEMQAVVRKARAVYYNRIFMRKTEASTVWNHLRHLGLIKNKNKADRVTGIVK